MNFKKWMPPVIIIFGIVTFVFYTLSFIVDEDWVEIVGVTLLTTYYQSCLRPFTGGFVNLKFNNKMDFSRKWFQEKKFEKPLYNFLKVRKWKNIMPTYDHDAFDIKKHSLEEIICATCQAEIVHELMLIESLLPLFLIIPYGRPLVFILTTLMCIIIELVFILIQRYNRPRLLSLLKRKQLKEIRKNEIKSNSI